MKLSRRPRLPMHPMRMSNSSNSLGRGSRGSLGYFCMAGAEKVPEKSSFLPSSGTADRPTPRGKPSRTNGLAPRWGRLFYLAIVRSVSHSLQSRAFIDADDEVSSFKISAQIAARNVAQTRYRRAAEWLSEGPFERRFSVRRRQSGRLRDARPASYRRASP
jgi:hypothetical protein